MTSRDDETFEDPADEVETGPKALREARDRAVAEAKEARQRESETKAQLMVMSIRAAGLDPTKGIGKAVARTYEGEPDADKIIDFAQAEYDWEPARGTGSPLAEVTAAAASRMEAGTMGAPPGARNFDEELAAAQQAGKWDEVTRLEMEKFLARNQ